MFLGEGISRRSPLFHRYESAFSRCGSTLILGGSRDLKLRGLGWGAPGSGVGVYVLATEQCQEVRIAALIDNEERQTNNAAELLAARTEVRLFNMVLANFCVVTDSE